MTVLKKILSHKATKFMAAALVSGSLIFGSGEDVSAAPNTDGMMAFKEAYLAAPADTRVFRQRITFFSNRIHAESDAQGQILRDATMRMKGDITWAYTNGMNTDDKIVPFYLDQNDKDLIFYVNRNGTWNKISLPGFPFGLTNALKSTNINVLRENMTAVKDVTIIKETDTQRVMDVTLDGKILSDLISKYSHQNFQNLSNDEKATQEEFLNTISKAMQTTDLTLSWTVDKSTWQTVTTSADLTSLMRAYGKQVLQDAADGKFVLTKEEREFMESIGYFCELHYYTTYMATPNNVDVSAPQGVENAVENNSVLNDLINEVNATVKK